MASNTPNLNLLKKDPATDGNDTFNIKTMLNDNWDKIDTAVKKVQDDLDHVSVPAASTTQAGIVQLTNATNSTSETQAPTAKALKSVADSSLPKTGGTISSDLAVKGGFSTIGNAYIRKNDQLGSTPAISLAIGDSDTGFNWENDGVLRFISNNSVGATLDGGQFFARATGGTFYHVGNEIESLKQSGVNFKNSLVAQLNAKNISTATSENISTLINKISEIKARTVTGQVPRTNDAMGTGQDGSPMYQFESTLTTKDFSFALTGINFFPEYLAVRLNEINGFYRNQPSSSIPLTNGVVRSDAAHIPVKDITFQILSRGNGSFVLRVTNTSSTYSTLRFTVASFSAVGI